MTESAFVPGARVAVYDPYGDGVTEGFVEKVYKTGNFTLRGSKQQWHPWNHSYSDKNKRWSATTTGNSSWRRNRLDLWDDETDAEIREKLEAKQIKNRWQSIRDKINHLKEPTATLCDAIESALSPAERE